MKQIYQKNFHRRIAIIGTLILAVLIAGLYMGGVLEANASPVNSQFFHSGTVGDEFPEPPGFIESYTPIKVEGLTAVQPIPISKFVDLTKGRDLTDEQIVVFIIQRSDGSYEQYLFPADFQGDVKVAMNLQENEIIIYSNPLSRVRSTPMPLNLDKPQIILSKPGQENQSPYPPPP